MRQAMAEALIPTDNVGREGNMDAVPTHDPGVDLISVDPERHSGTPCFAGTRVPVRDLFDYMEGGGTLESFLLSFPTVGREQAIRVLQLAEERLIEGLSAQ